MTAGYSPPPSLKKGPKRVIINCEQNTTRQESRALFQFHPYCCCFLTSHLLRFKDLLISELWNSWIERSGFANYQGFTHVSILWSFRGTNMFRDQNSRSLLVGEFENFGPEIAGIKNRWDEDLWITDWYLSRTKTSRLDIGNPDKVESPRITKKRSLPGRRSRDLHKTLLELSRSR